LFVLFVFGIANTVFSQEKEIDFQMFLASYNYDFSEDEVHELEEIYARKIDINNLNFDDYDVLFFLTEFEKKSLHAYIRMNWGLKSEYELAYILGFTIEKAQLLAQFICVKPIQYKRSNSELIKNGKHELSLFYNWQIMPAHKYSESFSYSGMPLKTNLRYRFSSYKKIYWGITIKNDMGEAQQKGPFSPHFDYSSAYIQYKNNTTIPNIIIGDYELKIGQGLTIWQGGFYAKNMSSSPIKKSEILKKHSSSNEFTFFRGASCSIKLSQYEITPFISSRKLDGYLKTDSLQGQSIYIYETGLHRSQQEIATRKQVKQNTAGIHLKLHKNKLQLGCTYLVEQTSTENTQLFSQKIGANYKYSQNRLTFFGEASGSNNLALAQIHGLHYIINEKISTCILYRKFDNSFNSQFAKTFAEQSTIGNEHGLYTYIETQLNGKHSFRLGLDKYKMPYETSLYAPRKGTELGVSWKYNSYDKINIDCNFGFETKTEEFINQLYNESLSNTRSKYSGKIQYILNNSIKINTTYRKGFSYTNNVHEKAFYVAQDVIVSANNSIKFYARYALYKAPYNTRLYAWEPDVTYAFSTPQVLYKGQQISLLIKAKIKANLQLQTKASIHIYTDKNELPEYYSNYKNCNKKTLSFLLLYTF